MDWFSGNCFVMDTSENWYNVQHRKTEEKGVRSIFLHFPYDNGPDPFL